MTTQTNETIAAIATAPYRGGVGIIRVSGPKALPIAQHILGITPKPRYAHYGDFCNANGDILDQGIALYFPNPHSFTGEDVLELQGHGGPVILDMLLDAVVQAGARLARPGWILWTRVFKRQTRFSPSGSHSRLNRSQLAAGRQTGVKFFKRRVF